ncbi:MAG: GIY-YIG nuclease family protein [Bacteroidota bacterium]
MSRSKTYHVYILANRALMLYIGMTSDLGRRVAEHRAKAVPGFTARYDIDRLVYVEAYADVHDAIARERQLKAGGARRSWTSSHGRTYNGAIWGSRSVGKYRDRALCFAPTAPP